MKQFWLVAAALLLTTLLPDGAFAQRGGHAARRRGCGVATRGARAAGDDELLISLGRNDRANRTGIPARLERVINTPERNS